MKLHVLILNLILITTAAACVSKKICSGNNGEYGHFYEGDIMLTPQQYNMFKKAKTPQDPKRLQVLNGMVAATTRWPKATVVYYLNSRFDKDELSKIKNAMQDIESNSCIKFREKTCDEEHAVAIQRDGRSCRSHIGYLKSRKNQMLNLASGCFKHGKIVHEIMHTLGFLHMHSNYNRDDYVRIAWDNIKSNRTHNFYKFRNSTITDFGLPYDFKSVMHYSPRAFTSNGQDTIIPKKTNAKIGQRERLSKIDILKLNKMYCNNE